MSAHNSAHRANVERFRRGDAGRDEAREVVRHLLSGCADCREVTSRIWLARNPPLPDAGDDAQEPAEHSDGYDYTAVFARVERQVHRHQLLVAEERAAVPGLRLELARHPRSRQEVLADNSSKFQSWSVVESLLDDCRRLCQSDQEEAAHLARLATRLAQRLEPEHYGAERVRDLQARSWAELANIWRIRGLHREAEQCFERARDFLAQGTGDPVEKAAVLSLEASMWNNRKVFDRAIALVDRTIAIARRLGESELLAKALIQKAKYRADRGCAEEALSLLLEAQQHLEPALDPRLAVTVQHNVLYSLVQAGRYEEAAAGLPDTRALYRKFDYPVDQIRLAWLEARIFRGLERPVEAEERFRFAFDRMLAEGLDYDAAMVGLDLAVLLCEQNRSAETRELAAAMLPVFSSQRIHQEAIAALLVFREAAMQERLSTELARRLSSYLQRSLTEPGLRFQAPPVPASS